MISLISILNRREQIIVKAKEFGFINLRLYKREGLDNYLHLVVDLDTSNPNAAALNSTSLETTFIELLKCQVVIMPQSQIKPHLKNDVLNSCANIEDVSKIAQLYNVDQKLLDTVQIEEPTWTEGSKRMHNKRLKTASQLLESLKGKPATATSSASAANSTFFSVDKPSAESSSDPQQKHQAFITELLKPENRQIATDVLLSLSPETLGTLSEKFESCKKRRLAENPTPTKNN